MNPIPARLPFDIEVCGVESIEAIKKEPFEFLFIAGVTPDVKWTNEEILGMFKVTKSVQCPIRDLILLDVLPSIAEMNVNF